MIQTARASVLPIPGPIPVCVAMHYKRTRLASTGRHPTSLFAGHGRLRGVD